jgi:hypothetical protein
MTAQIRSHHRREPRTAAQRRHPTTGTIVEGFAGETQEFEKKSDTFEGRIGQIAESFSFMPVPCELDPVSYIIRGSRGKSAGAEIAGIILLNDRSIRGAVRPLMLRGTGNQDVNNRGRQENSGTRGGPLETSRRNVKPYKLNEFRTN